MRSLLRLGRDYWPDAVLVLLIVSVGLLEVWLSDEVEGPLVGLTLITLAWGAALLLPPASTRTPPPSPRSRCILVGGAHLAALGHPTRRRPSSRGMIAIGIIGALGPGRRRVIGGALGLAVVTVVTLRDPMGSATDLLSVVPVAWLRPG